MKGSGEESAKISRVHEETVYLDEQEDYGQFIQFLNPSALRVHYPVLVSFLHERYKLTKEGSRQGD